MSVNKNGNIKLLTDTALRIAHVHGPRIQVLILQCEACMRCGSHAITTIDIIDHLRSKAILRFYVWLIVSDHVEPKEIHLPKAAIEARGIAITERFQEIWVL